MEACGRVEPCKWSSFRRTPCDALDRGELRADRLGIAARVEGGEDLGGGRVAPALVSGAGPGVRLVDEEPFTPVLALMEAEDTAAALREANRPDYGLVGYVVGRDLRACLETAQRLPLYQPLTMREFFVGTLGMERPQSLEVENVAIKGRLAYPQAPLQIQPPAKPLNLVWLVAESWRADTLNPRVMPQTNAFAAESLRYSNHFSGGNGTRISSNFS